MFSSAGAVTVGLTATAVVPILNRFSMIGSTPSLRMKSPRTVIPRVSSFAIVVSVGVVNFVEKQNSRVAVRKTTERQRLKVRLPEQGAPLALSVQLHLLIRNGTDKASGTLS